MTHTDGVDVQGQRGQTKETQLNPTQMSTDVTQPSAFQIISYVCVLYGKMSS